MAADVRPIDSGKPRVRVHREVDGAVVLDAPALKVRLSRQAALSLAASLAAAATPETDKLVGVAQAAGSVADAARSVAAAAKDLFGPPPTPPPPRR